MPLAMLLAPLASSRPRTSPPVMHLDVVDALTPIVAMVQPREFEYDSLPLSPLDVLRDFLGPIVVSINNDPLWQFGLRQKNTKNGKNPGCRDLEELGAIPVTSTAQHLIPEVRPHPPSEAPPGAICRRPPPGDISSETRSFTTRPVTSEFQQRGRRAGAPVRSRFASWAMLMRYALRLYDYVDGCHMYTAWPSSRWTGGASPHPVALVSPFSRLKSPPYALTHASHPIKRLCPRALTQGLPRCTLKLSAQVHWPHWQRSRCSSGMLRTAVDDGVVDCLLYLLPRYMAGAHRAWSSAASSCVVEGPQLSSSSAAASRARTRATCWECVQGGAARMAGKPG
eukprot:scaffold103234_cov62-Phaeocystis_antarctica.AAC.1